MGLLDQKRIMFQIRKKAKGRRFSEAFRKALTIKDDHLRMQMLCEIGAEQAKAGRKKDSKETFRKALSISDLPGFLGLVSDYQTKAGFFEEAVSTASKITVGYGRLSAYSNILSAQVEAGLKKKAGKTLELMSRTIEEIIEVPAKGYSKSSVLTMLAVAQAKLGYFKRAFATLEGIDDPEYRANVFLEIAKAQAKAGLKKEASKTFQQAVPLIPKIRYTLNPLVDRTERFIKFALTAKEAGLHDEARKTFGIALRRISENDPVVSQKANIIHFFLPPAYRLQAITNACDAYGKLASAQIEAGMEEEAPKMLERMISSASGVWDPILLSDIYSNIAWMQAAAGLKSEAKKTFKLAISEVPKIDPGRSLVATIFRRLVPRADPTDPCAPLPFILFRVFFPSITLAHIPGRALAYNRIAAGFAGAGFRKDAKKMFGLAVSEAYGIVDLHYRFDAFCDIALEQCKAGFAKDAKKNLDIAISAARRIDRKKYPNAYNNAALIIEHVKEQLERN